MNVRSINPSTLLLKSKFDSLSNRTSQISLSKMVNSLFTAPDISNYYFTILRLISLETKMHSVSCYRDGTLKKGKINDILNKNVVSQTNWRFISGLKIMHLEPGKYYIESIMDISAYNQAIMFILNKNSNDISKFLSIKNISLFEYLVTRITSALVSNQRSFICNLNELMNYEALVPYTDKQIREELTSSVKEFYGRTAINIKYEISNDAVEFELPPLTLFNDKLFHHTDNQIQVKDFMKIYSSMFGLE